MEKLGPDGELIFYYAGHGFPDEQTKEPYLIPVDVNQEQIYLMPLHWKNYIRSIFSKSNRIFRCLFYLSR